MSTASRLTSVMGTSIEVSFDDRSKIVFFSDCHRGDKSRADNFAPNSAIYMTALEHYHAQGYTYIEIGDGDELWENKHFSSLVRAHPQVYSLLQKFYNEGRLYMIWGNHDIVKKYRNFTSRNLYEYYNYTSRAFEPLFDNIRVHEGLLLRYKDTPYKILVAHGHQGDLLNDTLWPISCFLVRYVWRHLEYFGFQNPFSPARNMARMARAENDIVNWVRVNNQMLIAGHTHRASFPSPGGYPYFNSGCCVYHGYITGIEIQNGEIMLVKWSNRSLNGGISQITREVIGGPTRVSSFFYSGAPM